MNFLNARHGRPSLLCGNDTGPRDLRRLSLKAGHCYTSAASPGGFIGPGRPSSQDPHVLSSFAAGRRLAQRALAWQAVAVALTALAFLVKGWPWALAALAGGGSVALGGWLHSAIALGGGVAPAGGALARVLVGALAKWAVVLVVLVVPQQLRKDA